MTATSSYDHAGVLEDLDRTLKELIDERIHQVMGSQAPSAAPAAPAEAKDPEYHHIGEHGGKDYVSLEHQVIAPGKKCLIDIGEGPIGQHVTVNLKSSFKPDDIPLSIDFRSKNWDNSITLNEFEVAKGHWNTELKYFPGDPEAIVDDIFAYGTATIDLEFQENGVDLVLWGWALNVDEPYVKISGRPQGQYTYNG